MATDTTYLAPVPTYRIPLSVADMDAIETALKTAAVISEEHGHLTQASDFRVIRSRFEANRSIQLRLATKDRTDETQKTSSDDGGT